MLHRKLNNFILSRDLDAGICKRNACGTLPVLLGWSLVSRSPWRGRINSKDGNSQNRGNEWLWWLNPDAVSAVLLSIRGVMAGFDKIADPSPQHLAAHCSVEFGSPLVGVV